MKEVDASKIDYQTLVDLALEHCEQALLVLREQKYSDPSTQKLLSDLEPYILDRAEKTEWPGTVLLEGTATVVTFDLNANTALLLKKAVDSISEWIGPDLPEDLCFLREDGSPWLTSISHESEFFLKLRSDEIPRIERVMGKLRK